VSSKYSSFVLSLLLFLRGVAQAQTVIDPATLAKAQAGDAQSQFTVGDTYFGNNDTAHAADAFALMQKAAAQNLPAATADLGMFYVLGFGTPPDPQKGQAILEQAYAAGNDFAADKLAAFYANGQGDAFPKDLPKAMGYMQHAADDHDNTGEFDYGFELEGSPNAADQQKGLVYLQEAGDGGNYAALAEIGNLYSDGNGAIKANRATAESYYRKALPWGDASVMAALGADLVQDGDSNGGPEDAEAAKLIAAAAQAGNAGGEDYYGYILQHGRGLPEDDAGAVKWDSAAAAQGNIPATRRLGYLYANGIGTNEDDAKAKSLYETAAAAGDIVAMRLLGETLLDGNAAVKQQAASWFAKAAAGGDADAQNQLGNLYYLGQSVPKNMAKAGGLYQQSAAQHFARGETNMAECYVMGDCGPHDPAKAIPLLKDAVAQNDRYAEDEYGWLLQNGIGTQEDDQQAAYWDQRASAQNVAAATRRLGWLTETGKGTKADPAKADQLYTIAANQGDLIAMRLLGEDQMATGHDDASAIGWLAKAANGGDAYAQVDYGYMLEHGRGAPANLASAIIWYKRGAAQGQVNGENNLGLLYAQGHGLPKSDTDAAYWDAKAAAQGNPQAQSDLGELEYYGDGLPKNVAASGKLFAASAAQNYPDGQANFALCQLTGDCAAKDPAAGFALLKSAAAHGDALAEDVLGYYYLGGFGQPAKTPYALLWFRRAAADGNSHAAGELQEWHLRPAARAASDTDNTTITATGDIVPVLPASSCAAHGGYGDDTYCTKDGEQVDPASGVALAQNDPGYVDDDEINKNDEIEPGPDPSNAGIYDPSSEPGVGEPDIDIGGGGEPDIDIGGGAEAGD
jgi:TPR repeat protein